MGKKNESDGFVRWLHKRRYIIAKAIMISSNTQTHEPVSGWQLARLFEEFEREGASAVAEDHDEEEKESDAIRKAFEVGEGRRLRIILDLMRIDSSIVRFLSDIGMSDGDIVAMIEKTLRGQDVARIVHRGMLEGIENAFEHLMEQDERASESVRKWPEEKDG